MEDRRTPGLFLELGDLDPDAYASGRACELAATAGVERVTWWANNVPGRSELPMTVPDGTLLGVAEVDDRFVAPRLLPRTTARRFRRFSRPSQGVLTGAPTTGLLVVWISPQSRADAPRLRDWADFVHIRHIAAAALPGFTHITPYENVESTDPRFMHFYELDAADPEGAYMEMARRMAKYFGGSRTPEFEVWADYARAGGSVVYCNTFRLLGDLRPAAGVNVAPSEPQTASVGGPLTMEYVLIDAPRPGVAVVTLNRPERMNAMAFDVMIPFRRALEEVSDDNEVRVVVLTGAGEAFCSGADLEDAGRVPNIAGLTRSSIALRSMELLDDVVRTLRAMHQPVVGAVNGPAIGGGFCLATAADIRVASTTAFFRAAGINNGLTSSELGLSYLLPRAVGSSRAFEIMLSGRDVDAAEAERIGLVSKVVEPDGLLESCYELAERIIGFSRVGVELTKRMLWSSLDASSLNAHMDHEGTTQLYVRLTTENFEEAVLARRERRAPTFRD